jgi:hypothetical protein
MNPIKLTAHNSIVEESVRGLQMRCTACQCKRKHDLLNHFDFWLLPFVQ